MIFDVLLPTVLFLVTATTLYIHSRFQIRVESLLEERKLDYRYAVVMVVATGIMASVWLLIPGKAILLLFMFAYSLLLFLFTYLISQKWHLALVPPAVFITIYFSPYWTYFFNIFGVVFAILVSVLLGSLFEWKTTAVFVALITIVDVVQVLVTGHMVESGMRMVEELRLPVIIVLPTFPYMGERALALGLGDFFLSGLLSLQTARRYGRKLGFASAIAIAVVFLLFQTILMNSNVLAFPATVFIVPGWLISLAALHMHTRFSV